MFIVDTPILPSGDSEEESSEKILNALEECFANEKNKSSAEVMFKLSLDYISGFTTNPPGTSPYLPAPG